MALIRYVLYLLGVALFTWLLVMLEVSSPGSLKLHVIVDAGDMLGTSEYSPIEIVQPGLLGICGLLYAWVARYCPSQRPIAFLFGGTALAFIIRECDYFLDRYVADNFWQVLFGIVAALIIVYTYRQRRRFRIAWLRMWPSPGLTLLFAGAVIIFAFVRLVGHEPLWSSIMGDHYQRVVKLAVEEFIELVGYFLWLIGTIEYTFQARAIAMREPQPVAAKRRAGRFPKSEGRF
ncbi:MAG: hypothetical protein R3192_09165 [Woeseiaceae bacterium]|nr:hypothetical protein [Woeseiaceae bacterium]